MRREGSPLFVTMMASRETKLALGSGVVVVWASESRRVTLAEL